MPLVYFFNAPAALDAARPVLGTCLGKKTNALTQVLCRFADGLRGITKFAALIKILTFT